MGPQGTLGRLRHGSRTKWDQRPGARPLAGASARDPRSRRVAWLLALISPAHVPGEGTVRSDPGTCSIPWSGSRGRDRSRSDPDVGALFLGLHPAHPRH